MSLGLVLHLALLSPAAAVVAPGDPEPYIRLMEDDAGLRLELAARTFAVRRDGVPPGASPATVTLVAAMHLAQRPFYRRVQALLDDHELVLFEHVREELGLGELDELGPDERDAVLATGRRMEALLDATHAHFHRTREAPADVAALVAASADSRRLSRATHDVWSGALALEATLREGRLCARVSSLGRDGAPGGAGVDADREVELDVPAGEAPLRALQTDIARALGWSFQLDEIDDLAPRWRNSDVSLGELREALGGGDETAREFAAMLEGGGGALDGLMRGFLGLLGATRTGRSAMQLAVIEVLAQGERMFDTPPAEFADLFEVLIEQRNRVVCDDLAEALREKPARRRLAIFYGAGHLGDLERRLRDELGLVPIDTRWIAAVDLPWTSLAFSRAEAEELRVSFREAFEESLGDR